MMIPCRQAEEIIANHYTNVKVSTATMLLRIDGACVGEDMIVGKKHGKLIIVRKTAISVWMDLRIAEKTGGEVPPTRFELVLQA